MRRQKLSLRTYRMSNCQSCHTDHESGPAPASHTQYIKPDFHTESFRQHHSAEASAPGAKCFVCHANVSPRQERCSSASRATRSCSRSRTLAAGETTPTESTPPSTAKAAPPATSPISAAAATTNYRAATSPCRSSKMEAMRRLAMIDKRSCFACHTYQDTCAECHARRMR